MVNVMLSQYFFTCTLHLPAYSNWLHESAINTACKLLPSCLKRSHGYFTMAILQYVQSYNDKQRLL